MSVSDNKDLDGQPINVTKSRSAKVTSSRPSRSTSSAPKDRARVPSHEASSNCSSPTNSEQTKKIPPIKAPVGLAKPPDLRNVSSKIGSLANVKHKPAGGDKKPMTQKLDWSSAAKSKIGSLENKNHRAGGGEVKVVHQKLEWKVTSKVGSLDNVKHKPGGGQIQIFDEKYASRGSSRSSSTVRGTSGNNSGTSVTNVQPSVSETRGKADADVRDNIKQPNPLPLPMKNIQSTSSPAAILTQEQQQPPPDNSKSNIRSTSASRKSPPGSSKLRAEVPQQNSSANKSNDTNNSTASFAFPSSSNSATKEAANHEVMKQNENPNSNPKPPVAPKPNHNLKWWKNKK